MKKTQKIHLREKLNIYLGIVLWLEEHYQHYHPLTHLAKEIKRKGEKLNKKIISS